MLDAPLAKTGVIINKEDQLSWAFKLHAFYGLLLLLASLVGQMVKNPPGFGPWVGKIPWRRAGQPTPGFLPGESPWAEEPGGLQFMGRKESDTTEQLKQQHNRMCCSCSWAVG